MHHLHVYADASTYYVMGAVDVLCGGDFMPRLGLRGLIFAEIY